jgi:hypothetical protein
MIFGKVKATIADLVTALDQLSASQYTVSCRTLSGGSVGQHVRHVVELFQCLISGYPAGIVNYDARPRNQAIATGKEMAVDCLSAIDMAIALPDKPMLLETGIDPGDQPGVISTTYFREIVYNIEHAIHHMALIRIGITEVSDIRLSREFGVAPSTLKYQAACAL